MKILFSNQQFNDKPLTSDCMSLAKCASNTIQDLGIAEIATKIGSGHTFRPCIFNLGSGEEHIRGGLFTSAEFVALDFDNSNTNCAYVSSAQMQERFIKMGIIPCIMYPTFSSTPENNKFRAIFHLNETIGLENQRKYDVIVGMLLYLFAEADQCTKDKNRMFHGTNKPVSEFYIDPSANLDEIMLFQRYISVVEARAEKPSAVYKSNAKA